MTTNREHTTRRRSAAPSVLAYSLTALAALGAGAWAGARMTQVPAPPLSVSLASTGIIPKASPLHDALEQLPSGAERTVEGGVNVKPALSYRAPSGVWCRRFELRAPTGRTDAIACRGAEEWRIAALITGPNDAGGGSSGGRSLGSGSSGGGNLIDAAVATTIDGDPLDTQDELNVLFEGWVPEGEAER